MTELLSYHGNQELKTTILAKVEAHRQADRIIQGTYWRADDDGVFRGCAVGCVLEDPEGGHARYETEFGIPELLAHLEDGIFESLPVEQAREWPGRFMGAIPVGANLDTVWPRFAIWLMTDPTWGLEHITEAEDLKEVCRRVAAGYQQILDGGISDQDAQAITDAAWAAWAARDARDARAARAARDARDARAARAARDARDARDARAARAARDARAARAARDAWDAWAARAARAARDARAAWDAWAARAARDARDARAAFTIASADKLIELLTNP